MALAELVLSGIATRYKWTCLSLALAPSSLSAMVLVQGDCSRIHSFTRKYLLRSYCVRGATGETLGVQR